MKLDGPDAGSAGLDVYDQSFVDATMTLLDGDGSALVFTTPTGAKRTGAALPGGVWPAADDDTRACQVFRVNDVGDILVRLTGCGR